MQANQAQINTNLEQLDTDRQKLSEEALINSRNKLAFERDGVELENQNFNGSNLSLNQIHSESISERSTRDSDHNKNVLINLESTEFYEIQNRSSYMFFCV